jgi:TPR repeat protein
LGWIPPGSIEEGLKAEIHRSLEREGVPKNYAAAVLWFQKAAEQGLANAQGNLGFMYANGQGVPQDCVQAHKWWNLAAARFDASQNEDREKAVKSRDQIATKMTPAQIAKAQRLATEWKPKRER